MSHNWHPNHIELEPMERRLFYAGSPQTHPDVLRTLSSDPFWYIRNKAAENPSTPLDCLMQLRNESDFRIREAAEKTLLNHNAPCVFMLHKADDHKWSASISFPGVEGEGAKLADEQAYPVELIIRRTDMNGSSYLLGDICNTRKELLDALNWNGECRFSVSSLWDFHRETSTDPVLDELFASAYFRRMELVAADMYAMCADEEEEVQDTHSLDDMLNNAKANTSVKSQSFQDIKEELPF